MVNAAVAVVGVLCACGKRFAVPERLAGRLIRCKGCGSVTRLAAPRVRGWNDEAQRSPSQRWRGDAARTPARREQLWQLSSPRKDLVVLTPMALESSDELQLLPPEERHSPYTVRPGMQRCPAEVRRLERRFSTTRRARREPGHERHLRAIAFGYVVGGALMTLVTLCLAFLAFLASSPLLGVSALLAVVLSLLTVAVGVGLWRLNPYVRSVAVVLAVLALAAGCLTALGGLGAFLVASPAVSWCAAALCVLCSPRATTVLRADRARRGIQWWRSPFLWLPLGTYLMGGVAGAALILTRIVALLA